MNCPLTCICLIGFSVLLFDCLWSRFSVASAAYIFFYWFTFHFIVLGWMYITKSACYTKVIYTYSSHVFCFRMDFDDEDGEGPSKFSRWTFHMFTSFYTNQLTHASCPFFYIFCCLTMSFSCATEFVPFQDISCFVALNLWFPFSSCCFKGAVSTVKTLHC